MDIFLSGNDKLFYYHKAFADIIVGEMCGPEAMSKLADVKRKDIKEAYPELYEKSPISCVSTYTINRFNLDKTKYYRSLNKLCMFVNEDAIVYRYASSAGANFWLQVYVTNQLSSIKIEDVKSARWNTVKEKLLDFLLRYTRDDKFGFGDSDTILGYISKGVGFFLNRYRADVHNLLSEHGTNWVSPDSDAQKSSPSSTYVVGYSSYNHVDLKFYDVVTRMYAMNRAFFWHNRVVFYDVLSYFKAELGLKIANELNSIFTKRLPHYRDNFVTYHDSNYILTTSGSGNAEPYQNKKKSNIIGHVIPQLREILYTGYNPDRCSEYISKIIQADSVVGYDASTLGETDRQKKNSQKFLVHDDPVKDAHQILVGWLAFKQLWDYCIATKTSLFDIPSEIFRTEEYACKFHSMSECIANFSSVEELTVSQRGLDSQYPIPDNNAVLGTELARGKLSDILSIRLDSVSSLITEVSPNVVPKKDTLTEMFHQSRLECLGAIDSGFKVWSSDSQANSRSYAILALRYCEMLKSYFDSNGFGIDRNLVTHEILINNNKNIGVVFNSVGDNRIKYLGYVLNGIDINSFESFIQIYRAADIASAFRKRLEDIGKQLTFVDNYLHIDYVFNVMTDNKELFCLEEFVCKSTEPISVRLSTLKKLLTILNVSPYYYSGISNNDAIMFFSGIFVCLYIAWLPVFASMHRMYEEYYVKLSKDIGGGSFSNPIEQPILKEFALNLYNRSDINPYPDVLMFINKHNVDQFGFVCRSGSRSPFTKNVNNIIYCAHEKGVWIGVRAEGTVDLLPIVAGDYV
jgi:hypothetical protein